MKNKLFYATAVLISLLVTGCGSSNDPTSNISSLETSSIPKSNSSLGASTSQDNSKLNFENVFFDDIKVSYDGKEHILADVRGVPEGTSIVYTNRDSHVDVGSYVSSVVLSKEGYNDKTLQATLTITPIDFSGLTYESVSVTYDGKDHFNDITLVGILPPDTTTHQIVRNSAGEIVTSAIEIGEYTYKCEVVNKNYNKITLEATLTIKAQKRNLPVFVSNDGSIYFANGLHNSYLYCLDSSSTFNLVDYSSPKEFIRNNSSSALFIAGTPLLNSVKEVGNERTDVLYTSGNISHFVKQSDTVLYYSSNSLKALSSGIYKVDATNLEDEPVVTKIFEGKTDNLSLYNGYLYFSNGNDNNYLYKLNLSNNVSTLVLDEKVHEYIIDANKLYCTVNGKLNDYIAYIDLSSSDASAKKLTNLAGEFLTIKDGYLFYHCTDLFSAIDEKVKGIYRVNLSTGINEQVVAINSVNGFDAINSNTLVYIDGNNLHLYRYNISTKASTDLLDKFVAPEATPLNLGGETIAYKNKVYYLNMYAGKTLYCYDEVSKVNSQLTPNKVEDFYIYNDVLYFNQVTMLANNDLYSSSLIVSEEPTKISSNDVRGMVSDGTYMYSTHYNWAGVAGGISRMKLDGSAYIKFSEVNGAKNLTIKDNKLYYINCATGQDNGKIEYISLETISELSIDVKGTVLSNDIKNVKQFAFDGNNIFYIYNGTFDNSIKRTDFTSLDVGTSIASSKTNPSEFLIHGNDIYYYSYASSASNYAGFFKISKNAVADDPEKMPFVAYQSKYYATCLAITSSNNLYFMNYIPKLLSGDAHFYQINLSNNNVSKIA